MPEAANCLVSPSGTLGLAGVTVIEISELLGGAPLGDESPPP